MASGSTHVKSMQSITMLASEAPRKAVVNLTASLKVRLEGRMIRDTSISSTLAPRAAFAQAGLKENSKGAEELVEAILTPGRRERRERRGRGETIGIALSSTSRR
jgi:hypothetical protein